MPVSCVGKNSVFGNLVCLIYFGVIVSIKDTVRTDILEFRDTDFVYSQVEKCYGKFFCNILKEKYRSFSHRNSKADWATNRGLFGLNSDILLLEPTDFPKTYWHSKWNAGCEILRSETLYYSIAVYMISVITLLWCFQPLWEFLLPIRSWRTEQLNFSEWSVSELFSSLVLLPWFRCQ